MTRTEMVNAINAWKNIQKDDEQLLKYLEPGCGFLFDFPSYSVSGSSFIHAYPAIDDNYNMVFLLIPSQYDDIAYD